MVFRFVSYCYLRFFVISTLKTPEGMYLQCNQSFRWDVFQLIKDIRNYYFGMTICVIHFSKFSYGYFYSIKFTFLRPSKASKGRRTAQWGSALMLATLQFDVLYLR